MGPLRSRIKATYDSALLRSWAGNTGHLGETPVFLISGCNGSECFPNSHRQPINPVWYYTHFTDGQAEAWEGALTCQQVNSFIVQESQKKTLWTRETRRSTNGDFLTPSVWPSRLELLCWSSQKLEPSRQTASHFTDADTEAKGFKCILPGHSRVRSGPAAVPSPGLSSFLSASLTCLRNSGSVLTRSAMEMEATRDQEPGTWQVRERAAQGRMLLFRGLSMLKCLPPRSLWPWVAATALSAQ